jgi:hypothetical protein
MHAVSHSRDWRVASPSYTTLVISSGAGVYFFSSLVWQSAAESLLQSYRSHLCGLHLPSILSLLGHHKIAIESYSLLYNAHCAFNNAVSWRTPPDVGPVGRLTGLVECDGECMYLVMWLSSSWLSMLSPTSCRSPMHVMSGDQHGEQRRR